MEVHLTLLEIDKQGRCRLGEMLFGNQQKHTGRLLHRPLKPVPVVRRNPADLVLRHIAQVECNYTESAGVQEQIGTLQRMVEAVGALHPNQAVKAHAALVSGLRIERICRIHDRVIGIRLCSQHTMQESGSAGGGGTCQRRNPPTRQACQQGIQGWDAEGNQLRGSFVAPAKACREMEQCAHFVRFLFASSLAQIRGGCQSRK